MCAIVKTLLLSALFLVLSGFNDTYISPDSGFEVEKKYTLSECMVRLVMTWDQTIGAGGRYRILREADAQVSWAIVSGDFPLFSSHYSPRDAKYYVFYYADRCEQRRELVQELVDNYFLPNVPEFPEYKIEHEGFQPGFDGVMPSGLWIDG
ncbi:MAG: hypothetical protein COC05_06495 [Gammaproteobacteria bacterium]|nr:MAG: hypothetical protein COC05_06495 [Gammaproteobacteria bacterium]